MWSKHASYLYNSVICTLNIESTYGFISFVSLSPAAAAQGSAGSKCTSDYILVILNSIRLK